MSNKNNCEICNQKATADCVMCDICHKIIHRECAGLSRKEFKCVRTTPRVIHFYCAKCDIVCSINTLKDEIDYFKRELSHLKRELNDLQSKQNNVIESDPKKELPHKEIIEEIDERNCHSNNLMLPNLPESNASSSKQRKNDDILRCLNTILPETNKDY